MKKQLFLIALSLFSLCVSSQDFPYGKMLKMSAEELSNEKFKYNKKYNQWVLQKNNGLQAATNILGALNGQSADYQPHIDDYVVAIQKGRNDSVASINVQFYNDQTYHDLLAFATGNGIDVVETNSGKLDQVKFSYQGCVFVLQMRKVAKTTITTKTIYAAKAIDDSYNVYNFVVVTLVPAESPYLTKQKEKAVNRDAKGQKKQTAADLM